MLFGKKKSSEDFFDMFSQAGKNLVTAAGYLQKIANPPLGANDQFHSEGETDLTTTSTASDAADLASGPNASTASAQAADQKAETAEADHLEENATDAKQIRKDRKHFRELLHEIEHQNDELTHRIANLLDATFVTPMDRDDISLLAASLDDCMDYLDEAGDLIVLYKLGDIPKRLTKQIDILEKCAELTAAAMPKLREKKNLKDYTIEINNLENKGDKAYRKMLAELFESGLDPVQIIKVKDILECLESGCDSFERLANVVETIYIKES